LGFRTRDRRRFGNGIGRLFDHTRHPGFAQGLSGFAMTLTFKG